MCVGDHYRAFQESGFFYPSRSGHLAVAVQGKPAGEDGVGEVFPARQDGRDPRPHRPLAEFERAFPTDNRAVAYFDSGHVGDGVERSRSSIKGNAQIASSRLLLSGRQEGNNKNDKQYSFHSGAMILDSAMVGDDLSLSEARRIALAAQGLDRPRPIGLVKTQHLRRVIRQLGLLQIDYVNVLVPAHYQVLFSRLGPYQKTLLDDLVYRRREFTEQWAHEASILPMETWPLLRHRMETHRVRPYGFERLMAQHPDYVSQVLEEVRTRGPLRASDLPAPKGGPRRIPGAWHGSVPRAMLEAHFGRGLLAVADRRPNFARMYDLAERVIPTKHYVRRLKREDAQRELLLLAARSHGVGTAGDLADYYRMKIGEARPRIAELVESGDLREIRVEGWREPAYLHKEACLPGKIGAATLVSPFDPVIWSRDRVARLFQFDYRIEIFVPAPKRKWGYYVLPFLLGDRLVARVDLKSDRAGRRLLVLASSIETNANPGAVAGPLAAELRTMAAWLGLATVVIECRGTFARALAAVNARMR